MNDKDLDSNVLIKYGDEVFSQFSKKLEKAIQMPGNEKSVHELRTTIKKIKAYLRLIHFVNPDFKFKHAFRLWKSLFKELAWLRNWQMYSKLMEIKLHMPLEAVVTVAKSPFINLEGYEKIFNKEFYHKTLKNIESELGKSSVTKCILSYKNDIICKIKALLLAKEQYRTEKLHVLRKRLKEYQYNLDIIRESGISSNSSGIETWLKNVMLLLGDWHDIKSLIIEVKKDGKRTANKPDQVSIKISVLVKLKKIEEELIHKINRICADKEEIERLFPVV